MITRPTFAPKIPAAPTGPGVGGTREWVITSPPAKQTARLTMDFLLAFDRAFISDARITNPESQ